MLRTIASFLCIICILFSSCQPVPEKVTKEEAVAAAKRLEDIVPSRNQEEFASFFDRPAFVKILSKKSRAAKDHNIMNDFKSRFSMLPLAKTTIETVEAGSYRFLRNY